MWGGGEGGSSIFMNFFFLLNAPIHIPFYILGQSLQNDRNFFHNVDAIENLSNEVEENLNIAQHDSWISSLSKLFEKKRKKSLLPKCIF